MSSGLLIRLRTEDGRRHRNGSQAVPFVMWAHRWRFSTFGARARRRSSRSEQMARSIHRSRRRRFTSTMAPSCRSTW